MRQIIFGLFIFLAATSAQAADKASPEEVSSSIKQGLTLFDKGETRGAIAVLNKACDEGDGLGCSVLGYVYLWGDKKIPTDNNQKIISDPVKAAAAYEKGCALKDDAGCLYMAGMYMDGLGVEIDNKKVVLYLEKSCEYGSGDGCYALGSLYLNGDRVKKDKTQSDAYYKRACSLGATLACPDESANKNR